MIYESFAWGNTESTKSEEPDWYEILNMNYESILNENRFFISWQDGGRLESGPKAQ